MDAEEFLRRWEAMPDLHHAELIRGRAQLMASPVSARHSEPHGMFARWIGLYMLHTPGLKLLIDCTTRFDDENVTQPDAQLNLPAHVGGRTRLDDHGYVIGPPDLVVEIAYSTESKDFFENYDIYQRFGVREYIVWQAREGVMHWWTHRDGRFMVIPPEANGLRHSTAFPGLCVDPEWIRTADDQAMFHAIQQGCADHPDHDAFARMTRGDAG